MSYSKKKKENRNSSTTPLRRRCPATRSPPPPFAAHLDRFSAENPSPVIPVEAKPLFAVSSLPSAASSSSTRRDPSRLSLSSHCRTTARPEKGSYRFGRLPDAERTSSAASPPLLPPCAAAAAAAAAAGAPNRT